MDLVVCSKTKATRYLRSKKQTKSITHIVSIGDPNESFPQGYENHQASKLRLEFTDIIREWQGYLPATTQDIRNLISFVQQIQNPDKVLVHCNQGLSRSTAAAYVLLCTTWGPGREDEALQAVIKARPPAKPNIHIVHLGDLALGREGRMTEVLLQLQPNAGNGWDSSAYDDGTI